MTEIEADLVLCLGSVIPIENGRDVIFITSLGQRLRVLESADLVTIGERSRERLAQIAWEHRRQLPARLVVMAALKHVIS